MSLLLHEAELAKKMDTRLIERQMARGLLAREEVDQFVAHLPDETSNASWVTLEALEEEAPGHLSQQASAPPHSSH